MYGAFAGAVTAGVFAGIDSAWTAISPAQTAQTRVYLAMTDTRMEDAASWVTDTGKVTPTIERIMEKNIIYGTRPHFVPTFDGVQVMQDMFWEPMKWAAMAAFPIAAPVKASGLPTGVVANGIRGRASEARVLKDLGLTRIRRLSRQRRVGRSPMR